MTTEAVEKRLTPNDVGQTGTHQAGILVPKTRPILSFFPVLSVAVKNPRVLIDAIDEAGQQWTFVFIYYNNKYFGGTRNEYRLTGMTKFIRQFNLKAGDVVTFRRHDSRTIRIGFVRSRARTNVLKLSSSWRVIDS